MSQEMINESRTLAVALGANLPSKKGSPVSTLIAVRPIIHKEIIDWLNTALNQTIAKSQINKNLRLRWSPLFGSEPLGGPKGQPNYVNAVVVADGSALNKLKPSSEEAIRLLKRFLELERIFGRVRQDANNQWGPRTIDIDLLSWSGLQVKEKSLTLPHPRMLERNFVIVPLGEALNQGGSKLWQMPPTNSWDNF